MYLAQSQIKSEINLYKGENLYIENSFFPKNKTIDANKIIESYLLEIGSLCNEKKNIKFEVLPNGKLIRNIVMTGKPLPTVKVIYTNIDGNNKPVKIDKINMQNFITSEELKNSSIDNFLWIVSQFKNVYIINSENEAKKVQIERLPAL